MHRRSSYIVLNIVSHDCFVNKVFSLIFVFKSIRIDCNTISIRCYFVGCNNIDFVLDLVYDNVDSNEMECSVMEMNNGMRLT